MPSFIPHHSKQLPLKAKPKQRSATLISLGGSSTASSAANPDDDSSFELEENSITTTSSPPTTTTTTNKNNNNNNNPTTRRSLQLLNPSASPYVSLTPGLVSPDRHQNPSPHTRQFPSIPTTISHSLSNSQSSSSSSSNKPNQQATRPIPTAHRQSSAPSPLGLSTSQHTLKTLAGGRYYDEYDEDEEINPSTAYPTTPSPHPPPSACQASFPPSSSISSTPSSSLGRSQSQTLKAHIIDFNNTPTSIKNTKRHSSLLVPANERTFTRHPSPSTNSQDRPSPPRAFNLFSPQDWKHFIHQKPLLGFCIRLVSLVLLCAIIVGGLVWALLPPVDEKDLPILRIPTSFEALKKLNALLQIYKTANYYRVLSSFILIYLFLQAFSLPGSMYLSILAGAMFGVQVALPLVCMCVGTGAMLCYLMSLNLASSLVLHSPSIRSRLDDWKVKLSTKTNKLDLFAYLVVIRISPLPPHWVVNLLAPHVGIRLGVFWLTTCLGILPVSLIHTQLGTTLDQMVGPEDLSFLTPKNLTGLALVALGVLVPVLIRWYLRKTLDEPPTSSVSTAESRPFSARIGLSLEDDDEDQPQDHLGRRSGIRSLSGHTYDNSSITSLHKLGRVESSDTLLLSSSPPSSQPTRPSPRHYSVAIPQPPSSKTARLSSTVSTNQPIRNKESSTTPAQSILVPHEQDHHHHHGGRSVDEIKIPNSLSFHSSHHPRNPQHHHHLRSPVILPRLESTNTAHPPNLSRTSSRNR
ncbi:hypothetical protein PGT21_017935 [Puccinia graminis f. sp. tritici]|uniref:VTT domain-containing protein n=1 Tax=Puccinia graminis f. sp. tritici TaxID=56615 RepID=A0A5B0NVW5_PUCGR|nr:hypothetical protein PGT21_017935 [Puccinia graminis f. sp. tritici]KAA1093351.1 hypothetical protein PGTUg99_024216 [Puccinia graminis f. sp. tritici]